MLDALTRGERYVFTIGVIIALLVYFGGVVKITQAVGPQAANLLTIGQGRIASGPNAGQFPAYATGGPTIA